MRRILWTGAAILLGSGLASAHHGYASYDRQRTLTIEGQLERIVYENPHTVLTIRTTDGQDYIATWGSLVQVRRGGVAVGTLKAGDYLIVSGSPHIGADDHTLMPLTEIRRPSDGWIWSRQPPRP